jgi:hypothetical protein
LQADPALKIRQIPSQFACRATTLGHDSKDQIDRQFLPIRTMPKFST